MPAASDYSFLLHTLAQKQWQKLGFVRRAGVSTPLFSLYSSQSTGIAEYADLELLAAWCRKTRMSMIQLLPMNDTGFQFTPYDAASTFALEPVYLRPAQMQGVRIQDFKEKIEALRVRFPAGQKRVDYGIKKAKLELFREMFQSVQKQPEEFRKFIQAQAYWLDDYAVYKVLKEEHGEAGWESWAPEFRQKQTAAVEAFKKTREKEIFFHQWLQWQCFLQASKAKQKCDAYGVYLMGDLPFLVSRDSADVWAHQDYFKLDRVAGAPPDAFFANGQRWGMPAYDWHKIETCAYDYLIQKVRYAENFYDLFRIDHVVGTFRLWTIAQNEPAESGGLKGLFDPLNEIFWEAHGRKILSVMVKNTQMLPCAEDLGVVPDCAGRVLGEFGIPGMEVQRWTRDWGNTYDFKSPSAYKKNSMALVSNHDMTTFKGWWLFEAGTTDAELFKRKCTEAGVDFEKVSGRLFDLSLSKYGRLRWREDISDVSKLAWAVEKAEHEIHFLIGLYREAYHEREKFCSYLGIPFKSYEGVDFKTLAEAALRQSCASESIFSLQLIQDWLWLGDDAENQDAWNFRINFPGTSGLQNWTLVMPVSPEGLNQWGQNSLIQEIHKQSLRE